MKYLSTVFLYSLISVAIAQDDGERFMRKDGHKQKNLTPDQNTCRRMFWVNRAQQIALNTTRIEMIAKKDPQRAQRIREIAIKDGPELSKLQQNKTLTAYCDVYQASERQKMQCWHVNNVEKLEKRIKDKSAVEEAAKRHHASPEEVRKRWQHEIDSANQMKSNKTFTDACSKTHDSKKQDSKKQDSKTTSTTGQST